MAVPVCQFARATQCRRLAEMAAFGYDHLPRQTFYGVRFQVRICWPGVITQFELAPGNRQEMEAVYDLTPGTTGLLIGERNDWSPALREDLAAHDVILLAPYRSAKRDPWPRLSSQLSRWRSRSETIFGRLVERTAIKHVWARDLWHLGSRILRTVLMHTLLVWLNVHLERPPCIFKSRERN